MKLPHWVAVATALAIVVITWVMNQAASGALVIPAAVLTALTVGKTVLQLFTDNVAGGTPASGSKAVAAPATSTNGPVPPAAARTWTAPAVRKSGVYRVFALPVAAALSLAGCTNGVPNPQTVTGVTIGLNGAICVLTTYSTDVAAGKGEAEAVADAAVKCGLSIAQATGLLDAHRKAETLEASKQAAAK